MLCGWFYWRELSAGVKASMKASVFESRESPQNGATASLRAVKHDLPATLANAKESP
jgi:hypothetical protein